MMRLPVPGALISMGNVEVEPLKQMVTRERTSPTFTGR
jgi:hypothetical protein